MRHTLVTVMLLFALAGCGPLAVAPTPTQPGTATDGPSVADVRQTATALAAVIGGTQVGTALPNTLRPVDPPFPGVLPTQPPAETLPDTGGDDTEGAFEAQGVRVVASVPVQVFDAGTAIGYGEARLYAPEAATYPDRITVALELRFLERFTTPAPDGRATETVLTATPRPGTTPSPTPNTYRNTVPVERVYERMGAALACPPDTFTGCTEQLPTYIADRDTSLWTWNIQPGEAARGNADLTLTLFTLDTVPGGTDRREVWRASVPVALNPAAGGAWTWLLGTIVVAAGVGGTVAALMLRRTPLRTPATTGAKPLVFLSYRRSVSWAQARSVASSLQRRGANVFLDLDDINEGRFEQVIRDAIERADFFVVLLAPGTLESEWVNREIRAALAAKKVIIPLLTDGFRFGDDLPSDLADLGSHNSITVLPEFFEEAMERLATRFLKLPPSAPS